MSKNILIIGATSDISSGVIEHLKFRASPESLGAKPR
jgi:hypothetical protein